MGVAVVTVQPDDNALRAELEQAHEVLSRLDYARAHDALVDLRSRCDPSAGPGVVSVRVRVLISLATTALEVGGDLPDSLSLLDEAVGLAEDHDQPEHLGVVIGARAYCNLRTGRLDRALELFAELEPHLDFLSARDRATALNNRGAVHLDQGRVGEAIRDLERVQADAAEAGHLQLQAKALHNLGYAAFLMGDLPAALEQFRRIGELAGDPAELRELYDDIVLIVDRARTLLEAGLIDDADELLGDALAGAAGTNREQDQGEAHLARARGALIAGDLEVAADQTRLARDCFLSRENRLWLRRVEFMRLAVEVEELQAGVPAAGSAGDSEASSARAHEAAASIVVAEIEHFLEDPTLDETTEASARSMLAEAALLAGDRQLASQALAAPGPAGTAPVSSRLRWYRARAGLAVAIGTDDVQEIVDDALSELARAQSRLGSADLRTAMAIHGRELAELGVTDALARSDPDLVHAAVERSHASSTRLAPVRARTTEAEARDLALLRRANDALWRLDTEAEPIRARELRSEIARLERRLRQQGWQRAGARSEAEIVELDEVRGHLAGRGAVVASFTSVGPDLRAVRIDRDGVDVCELGELAPVLALVDQLHSDLQAVVLPGIPEAVRAVMQRSIRTTLARLDERLVAPLEVDGAPLVVVPHDGLALVPWPMLPRRLGRATTSVPCLTQWARCNATAAERSAIATEGAVVAVSGPGLERADAEVTAVAQAWPGARIARGADATGVFVQDALHSAGVVHLAAHGVHKASSPLFSSLRLADGPIFAHELEPDPSARLVVLSSCEVGSHTVRRGDEPLGLTAALLQAGVPTVVAGVARVRDDVAHDVMTAVHRELVGGASPAAALGTAVAEAHDAGRVAPFACGGAGLLPLVQV